MKLLVLILISPLSITGENYRRNANPNDEPFLPIYPMYPYSPKLMKRGVDKDMKDILSQLNSEIYVPKQDIKDSYGTKFSGNYQRDIQASYKTNIELIPNPSNSIPSQSIHPPTYGPVAQSYNQGNPVYSIGQNGYSTYYNGNPQSYTQSPNRPYNGYQSVSPSEPYQSQTNSQYNQYTSQPQVYYSNTQKPFMAYLPMASQMAQENPPPSGEVLGENEFRIRGKGQDTRLLNDNKDVKFIDGGNYLSNNFKDLDTQSSTYRVPIGINGLENLSDLHLRSVQLPRQSFRLMNSGGQQQQQPQPQPQLQQQQQQQQSRPVTNFPIHPAYKLQFEQIMSQALAKFLAQNGAGSQAQTQYDFGQGQTPVKPFSQSGPVIAKTGLAYVMNPTPFHVSPRHITKNPDASQVFQMPSGPFGKFRKPTTVSVEASQSYYIQPMKSIKSQALSHPPEYANYEISGQTNDHEAGLIFDFDKSMPNQSPDENQSTYLTPQAQNYQYANIQPGHYDDSRNYKTILEDVDFESRRSIKRSPKESKTE